MKKFYIFLLFVLIWQTACGTEAAPNENTVAAENSAANENVSNKNAEEDAARAAKLAEEPVPKFENAADALKKGNEYFDANLNEKAIEAYRQAVELDADLAEAHFKLGVAYALEEKEDEEDPDAVNAAAADDNASTDGGEKKSSKKKKGKKDEKILTKNSEKSFDNAIKAYEKYLKKNPKDHVAHFNLGRAYNKLFEDEDARKALEEAVELNGEDSLYRTELGATLIKLAQYPEAIKQLKKAVELDEYNARAEDLLEQAEAGRKRVDYGAKEKAKTMNLVLDEKPKDKN